MEVATKCAQSEKESNSNAMELGSGALESLRLAGNSADKEREIIMYMGLFFLMATLSTVSWGSVSRLSFTSRLHTVALFERMHPLWKDCAMHRYPDSVKSRCQGMGFPLLLLLL
eukprot:scpid111343/ scgid0012/ 